MRRGSVEYPVKEMRQVGFGCRLGQAVFVSGQDFVTTEIERFSNYVRDRQPALRIGNPSHATRKST